MVSSVPASSSSGLRGGDDAYRLAIHHGMEFFGVKVRLEADITPAIVRALLGLSP